MTKKKEYIFFSAIIGFFYISLLYLDCFSKKYLDTYQLKYGIIWIFFLETTFSLLGKGVLCVWRNWLWKLRFAVLIADFYFLFTPYNAAGIGGYLVVQLIYWERLTFRQNRGKKKKRSLVILELVILMFLTGIGIFFENYVIYILGLIYGLVLFYNLKTVWELYFKGEEKLFYLALSLIFLALCDSSIFLNFIWNKELIGNLIWCFYIPSQLLLANYE